MKTFITLFLLLGFSANSWAQANVTLSNLSVNTKINASLKPKTTGILDLGKSDSAWKNLYLNGSVFLNGKKTVHSASDDSDNILIGTGAGINITTGIENIAIGNSALNQNQTGSGNIAIGKGALFINSASNNTAVGDQAMENNTSGIYNSSLGYKTLFSNTSGIENIAVGALVLQANTTGNQNTAIGFNSMPVNTSGSYNTATGLATLFSNTTGYSNVATGYSSLSDNTTGYQNTASGVSAMANNTSGILNTASGFVALNANTTGSYNTAIGVRALYYNTTQAKNTAVGYAAGDNHTSSASTFIGYGASTTVDAVDNSTALGFLASVSASNQVRVGNSNVKSIGGFVGWSNISDGRVKKNIKQNVPGLSFINKLNPVTYNLDLTAADKILGIAGVKNDKGKVTQPDALEAAARTTKEQIIYTGFVAQDVEKAAKLLNYDFSGVDAAKNDKDLYGLRYAEFVVPLVKAVQELSTANDTKDKQITELTDKVKLMEEKLNLLMQQTQLASQSAAGTNKGINAASILEQNTPNPFSESTSIKYNIPSSAKAAMLNISSSSGQVLKIITIAAKGSGQMNLGAGDLAAGTYYYTLIIDGVKAGSKKMIVIK